MFRKREKGKHDFKYWNPLMTHFAGYSVPVTQDPDVITKDDEPKEKKIGDQANLEFTRVYTIAESIYKSLFENCEKAYRAYIHAAA